MRSFVELIEDNFPEIELSEIKAGDRVLSFTDSDSIFNAKAVQYRASFDAESYFGDDKNVDRSFLIERSAPVVWPEGTVLYVTQAGAVDSLKNQAGAEVTVIADYREGDRYVQIEGQRGISGGGWWPSRFTAEKPAEKPKPVPLEDFPPAPGLAWIERNWTSGVDNSPRQACVTPGGGYRSVKTDDQCDGSLRSKGFGVTKLLPAAVVPRPDLHNLIREWLASRLHRAGKQRMKP